MEHPLSAIEQRSARYDILFRGEDPYDLLPDEALVGLSGLCRVTKKSVHRSPEFRLHLDTIPQFIEDTLIEHDLAAIDGRDAIFCFWDGAPGDARARVTETVAEVFRLWEITSKRHRLDRLIAPGNLETKWLIVETAAAAMQIFHESPYNYQNPNETSQVARILANWGPLFARKWFNGQLIEDWGHESNFTNDEIKEWQLVFTPSIRKRFAFGNVTDPVGALRRVKANLEEPLAISNIATALEWSMEEVEAVFNPALRKEIAVRNINDPSVALGRIKVALEEILTTDNIIQQLGWATEEVESIFNLSLKKSIAIHSNPNKLLKKFALNYKKKLVSSNIAAVLDWTLTEVEETFTSSVKSEIAIIHRDDPISAVKRVARNLSEVLTTDNIAERTGFSSTMVEEIFAPAKRRFFALSDIDNPLKGCVDWLQGNITLDADRDRVKDSRLRSMEG